MGFLPGWDVDCISSLLIFCNALAPHTLLQMEAYWSHDWRWSLESTDPCHPGEKEKLSSLMKMFITITEKGPSSSICVWGGGCSILVLSSGLWVIAMWFIFAVGNADVWYLTEEIKTCIIDQTITWNFWHVCGTQICNLCINTVLSTGGSFNEAWVVSFQAPWEHFVLGLFPF